jgi:hypothetical protein
MATLSFGQTPSYVSTTGLVGWWPFNGNAIDESANTNDGTINGATLTTDRFGVSNSAYQFNGAERIDVPILFNYNERSISVWFTLDEYSTLLQEVINNDNPNLTYGSTDVSVRNDDTLQGQMGIAFCVFQEQPLNQWTNVIITRDLLSTKLFLNGTLICDKPNSNVSSVSAVSNYLKIGCSRNNDRYFNGKIDDIGLWNRALTQCEISDLYHSQLNWLQVSAGNDLNTCIGNSVTLSGLGNSSQYTWNNGATNNLPFTPTISGSTSYTVTGTDPSGCVAIDVSTVTVNPIPLVNAGIDQTVCTGNTVTLSGNGATTYSWNNGVSNEVEFIPTFSNDYIVIGTDINGCIDSDTMNVSVNNHTSSILTKTALDSYTLNGQTYTQSGTYTQVIPNELGCDSTITLNLTLNFTGISEVDSNRLTIYPNPAYDKINIIYEGQLQKIELVDLKGDILYEFSENIKEINLPNNIITGLYILKVYTESDLIYKRLILY